MISKNKTLSMEEARELLSSCGMQYPNTEHNRIIMKKAVDEFLLSLRSKTIQPINS